MASSEISKKIVHDDPWHSLRSFTKARIALGKTGVAIPLKEVLEFKLAHALARDAVFSELKTNELYTVLQSFELPVYLLHSIAADRTTYMQRPDYGRRLDGDSAKKLTETGHNEFDIAVILADGLSAPAVNIHAIPLLEKVFELLKKYNYSVAPVTLVQQGRVAIADEIGYLLHAKLSIILIGERPGLTTAESLGAYITYHPKPGLTDEARNCVSNIHPDGMGYDMAAEKIVYLARAAMEFKLSGINLKDDNRLLL
jgi:ethanolamine ammonia-lyase small subunit